MGKSGAMPSFETVDKYISSQPPEAQVVLNELRSLIHESVPEVIEIKNYKVPSFILNNQSTIKQQLMFVAYAKYISFYPFQAAIDHFAQELNGFEIGKGTMKLKFNQPLPSLLIKKMVLFRKEELSKNV